MANYKGTDTDLISVANAIRAKRNINNSLEWPSGYISQIRKIGETVPEIVSWSTGTDAEIAAMVEALDKGVITVEETGWQIGDERVVSLSAMEATGVGESHVAQDVTFVLVDSGHFNLTTPTSGGDTKDHFVVAMKDCLKEKGYYYYSAYNDYITWGSCTRRTWCNNVFRMAIPETLRACFKQFQVVTGRPNYQSGTDTVSDYFSLFGAREVFPSSVTFYINPSTQENAALTTISWYNNSRRSKKIDGTAGQWMLRSQPGSRQGSCIIVNSDGANVNYTLNNNNIGISPFGCI